MPSKCAGTNRNAPLVGQLPEHRSPVHTIRRVVHETHTRGILVPLERRCMTANKDIRVAVTCIENHVGDPLCDHCQVFDDASKLPMVGMSPRFAIILAKLIMGSALSWLAGGGQS